jgi:hypothetical protein
MMPKKEVRSMIGRKRLGKSMTREEFFEGFEAGKLDFGCAWCNKPIDNPEFHIRIRLPTTPKEGETSPSEARRLKKELYDGLTSSPVMKLVMVADDAIYVDYWFCSKEHEEVFMRSFASAIEEAKKS